MKNISRLLWLVIAAGIVVKILLLLTSQSVPDGDECVEGLMAKHIITQNVHPIYPYGIDYGAGVFFETHLAAFFFAIFGISAIALKSVGILFWLIAAGLVFFLSKELKNTGSHSALLAAALFVSAPQSAQWAMKVAGGHWVAIVSVLFLALMAQKYPRNPWVAVLIPWAAFSHPIVFSAVILITVYLFFMHKGKKKIYYSLILLVSVTLFTMLLWPRSEGLWDPSNQARDIAGVLLQIPKILVRLFTPNLNSPLWPQWYEILVALIWLGAAVAAALVKPIQKKILVLIGCAFLIIFSVNSEQLVARHLLLLYPLVCILIARGFTYKPRKWKIVLIAVLLISGFAVQVKEMVSPYFYGPGTQAYGIERKTLRSVLENLKDRHIHHVYCTDPLLQWNIVFMTDEQIVARWSNPQDRYPLYQAQVDSARLAGEKIAVVAAMLTYEHPPRMTIQIFTDPEHSRIESEFPRSPLLR